MRIGKRVHVYCFHFKLAPLFVTVHLLGDKDFAWRRIVGIQVGSWFFGAIKGSLIITPERTKA